MLLIEQMYAFVTEDERKGVKAEGVIGFQTANGDWMPMVGADMDMVRKLIPAAEMIKQKIGRDYKIILFSTREDATERIKKEVLGERND